MQLKKALDAFRRRDYAEGADALKLAQDLARYPYPKDPVWRPIQDVRDWAPSDIWPGKCERTIREIAAAAPAGRIGDVLKRTIHDGDNDANIRKSAVQSAFAKRAIEVSFRKGIAIELNDLRTAEATGQHREAIEISERILRWHKEALELAKHG